MVKIDHNCFIGKTFGKLTVTAFKTVSQRTVYTCRCSCGTTKEILRSSLVNGKTQSCGCFKRENPPRLTHGGRQKDEYKIWAGVKNRCQNSKLDSYKYYGGRGITLDPRWQKFENFYADMGPRPSANHQIDRKDTNGNYTKDNCHWITQLENSRNRSCSIKVLHEGLLVGLKELSQITQINYGCLAARHQKGDRGEYLVRPI